MLTKTDFAQIRKIIREEIENESTSVKEELGAEIKLSRIELQREIKTVAERVKNLEIAVRKIQKDIKIIVNFFDKEYLGLRKRLEIIEEHLHLSSAQ